MDYKIEGFIAGAHKRYSGNSHFMNNDGVVLCGSDSRIGFDASIVIKFRSIEDFDHDQDKAGRYNPNKAYVMSSNHLPLRCFITCKKCQNKLAKILSNELELV